MYLLVICHNYHMRIRALIFPLVVVLLIACGNKTISGKYRIEQQGSGFGNGMDQVVLEIMEDKTYKISAGQATWFTGTWSLKGDILEISSSNSNMGTTFRSWKDQLFPIANGKEVPGWSWVR